MLIPHCESNYNFASAHWEPIGFVSVVCVCVYVLVFVTSWGFGTPTDLVLTISLHGDRSSLLKRQNLFLAVKN